MNSTGGDVERWPEDSLLKSLTQPERHAILRLGSSREYKPGATLIRQGELDRDIFVLLSGTVRVVSNNRDGSTTTLAIRQRGDVIGEVAALDERSRSATVIAATLVHARVIDSRSLMILLREQAGIEKALSRYILTKLRQSTMRRSEQQGPVRQRLAQLLLDLAQRYGHISGAGATTGVPLSQVELGAFIGATEGSVHRALTTLRRDGLIETGHRNVSIVDVKALTDLAQNG